MRRFIRRFSGGEAGEGLVEYSVLIALVALSLIGVLGAFGNTVGAVGNRTAVSISQQAAGGYGPGSTPPRPSIPASPAPGNAPSDPDTSAAADPDTSVIRPGPRVP